jgi:adenylate cyclase
MRGPLRILGGVLETNAYLIVSLIALGMGVAFVVADRRSPASRALAGSFVFIGLSIYLNVVLFARVPLATAWSGWLAVPEAIAIVCVLEWILRVRRTLPVAPGVDTRAGDYGLRLGQLSGLVYGAFSLLWPQLRLQAFIRAADHPELFLSADFWLFMAPIALAMFAGLAGILLLLNRRPDRAEAIRVVAMALATPLFVAGFVLPV